LSNYFSVNFLQTITGLRNSYIHNALLKHGYSNFSLYILEYCEKNNVLVREQYYIDLLVPEYNILKKAGSSLGYKHSTEAIEKIINAGKGRFFSEEARVKMRAAALQRIDQIRSSVARANGRPVLVKNVETGEILEFASQKEASKQLGYNEKTVGIYIKSQKLLSLPPPPLGVGDGLSKSSILMRGKFLITKKSI
jgi:group I intron endonuclease